MDAYRSFIYSCQNLKAISMSFKGSMNKHPHNGYTAVENSD